MTKSIFITATGTDVGKTYVSALLVKCLREEIGQNCGYYKPVLSGAIKKDDGTLLPGDCDFVVKTANLNIDPLKCVSYCFEEAVSPHLASKRSNVKISLKKIKDDYMYLKNRFDTLIVEGAGGITCPLNLDDDKILLPDIIKTLGLDVILVADAGLGTINHVLLTVEYAKSHGINIIGIIYNNYESSNFMHVDNIKQIEKLTGIKTLAKVKYGAENIELLRIIEGK